MNITINSTSDLNSNHPPPKIFRQNFVVKLEAPILQEVYDFGQYRNSVRYRSPVYMPYSSLASRPAVLDEQYSNPTAFLQKVTKVSSETYLIRETGLNASYKRLMNKLIFTADRLGDVDSDDVKSLSKRVKKLNNAIGFIRYDPIRWFEYSHDRDKILFSYYKTNETSESLIFEGSYELTEQPHVAKKSIYYQTTLGYKRQWKGNLFEIGTDGLVYLM